MTDKIQWLAHDGGLNPVRPGETLTHVKFRSGFEYATEQAKMWTWQHSTAVAYDNQIIAYAVSPPRREPVAADKPVAPKNSDIAEQIRQRIAEIDAANPERCKLVRALEALG